jgi:hypothetical protein
MKFYSQSTQYLRIKIKKTKKNPRVECPSEDAS